MTTRFGYRSTVAGKDPFWDLFQMTKEDGTTNFSYQSGNKESIFIIHLDKNKTGGLPANLSTRTDQERAFLARVLGAITANLGSRVLHTIGWDVVSDGSGRPTILSMIYGINQGRKIPGMPNGTSTVF